MRRLIVNADDFGLTSGVNRGIVQAHAEGIVTSSTLMACGVKFDEAATLAASSPTLSVGCHAVLVDGLPTLAAKDVSCLLSNSGPRFRESIVGFAFRATSGRLDERQIEAEVTAQIKKVQAAGIRVSHLDSHKHTHIFPVALRGMIRAAQNCSIKAIRNPFEPLLFATSRSWKRQFQLGILRRYRAAFRNDLAQAGMVTTDGCVGILATGGLTPTTFQALIENLPEGTWEFVSHPGYNDAELDKVHTRLRDSRERELAILTSPDLRKLLEGEGIQLISYHDLAET